ncbi:MAG TPA: M18 family aminopeptidase [Tissierellales bacterium]|nr:M18 family aminopeptidase [Tissierellales bacterium]
MSNELTLAKELINLLDECPSPFHVVERVEKDLIKEGFKKLDSKEKWEIKKGGKYFVTKNKSALIAFVVGKGEIEEDGFRLIGAHTDSPTFRVKPNPEMVIENNYLKLNTEVYGGPILNTWFDRPLSLAGRVAVRSENPIKPDYKLLNIDKPIMIIPNLAVHMNRKVNEGVKINAQTQSLPLLAMVNEEFEKDNYLLKVISKNLGIIKEDILDFDLFLYEYEKGNIIGLNNEFISSGRLDDLSMVHAGIKALVKSEVSNSTNIMVCFDNEEVGSMTKQGAASPMLKTILERITFALGKDREDFFRGLYNSFIVSADAAHGVHPNYTEQHDPTNRPIINKGPAIKISANQSYTSDSFSSTVYENICKAADVPVQRFVNRSDKRGGSTIGPISSSQLDIPSVDIGNPLLAMHSIRELGGVMDHYYVYKSFLKFYEI